MKRKLIVAGVTLAAGYLAIAAFAFFIQRSMLFPRPPPRAAAWGEKWSDPLAAYSPPPPGGAVVVHFHGNADTIASFGWLAAQWRHRGFGFLAVEYPGYDGDGEPSEARIIEASERAVVKLEGLVGRDRVILVGQSLGTGVAVELAARGHGRKVALLTPYVSIAEMGAKAFPFLPVGLLVRDRFDSGAAASKVAQPVLVVHGTADEVIPYEQGERLSKMLPRCELVTIEGGHHNDLWDRPEMFARLASFASTP